MLQKLIWIVLSLPSLALAQKFDPRIEKQITELKANKTDTLMVFQEECIGCIPRPTDCSYERAHVLFWKKNNDFFYQKLSDCKLSEIIKIDDNNPLAYYLRYKKIIDKEEVKNAEYISVDKLGKKHNIGTFTSHDLYYNYYFQINNKITEKSVSQHQLNYKKFEKNHPNIHYKNNQKTHLVALIKQMKKYTKLSE